MFVCNNNLCWHTLAYGIYPLELDLFDKKIFPLLHFFVSFVFLLFIFAHQIYEYKIDVEYVAPFFSIYILIFHEIIPVPLSLFLFCNWTAPILRNCFNNIRNYERFQRSKWDKCFFRFQISLSSFVALF